MKPSLSDSMPDLSDAMTTLSPQALLVIESYLRVRIGGKEISCPYDNNRRQRVRGALRVGVGKGTALEIVEEAETLAIKEKINFSFLEPETIKKFLVDHNLGIDCSALAYYILDAELRAKKDEPLSRRLICTHSKNPLRRLIAKTRPVENTSTRTLANDANSVIIHLNGTSPGDMIVMLGTGERHDRDHVMVVHEVAYDTSLPYEGRVREGSIRTLHYTQALAWRTDGPYRHGVRQGAIEIIDPAKPLLEQRWIEDGNEGRDNGTFEHATQAQRIEIRRLRALSSV